MAISTESKNAGFLLSNNRLARNVNHLIELLSEMHFGEVTQPRPAFKWVNHFTKGTDEYRRLTRILRSGDVLLTCNHQPGGSYTVMVKGEASSDVVVFPWDAQGRPQTARTSEHEHLN